MRHYLAQGSRVPFERSCFNRRVGQLTSANRHSSIIQQLRSTNLTLSLPILSVKSYTTTTRVHDVDTAPNRVRPSWTNGTMASIKGHCLCEEIKVSIPKQESNALCRESRQPDIDIFPLLSCFIRRSGVSHGIIGFSPKVESRADEVVDCTHCRRTSGAT